MAYTPTVWATGDIITAEKLNKMEQGIENAGIPQFFVVHGTVALDQHTATLDKTYEEMVSAVSAGAIIIAIVEFAYGFTGTFYMSGTPVSTETGDILDIFCVNTGSDEGELWVEELSLKTGIITTLQTQAGA